MEPVKREPATSGATKEHARRTGPIVPPSTAGLRTMMIAMSAMGFLASLAIAGLLMVSAAASAWTAKVGSELTVQVRPSEGVDTDQAVETVSAVLAATPGIKHYYALSRDDSVKLLKPWLGAGATLEDLPVPRLIGVVVDGRHPPDLDRLALAIAAATPGANLDSHRRWQTEMVRLASALRYAGFAILAVIAATAAALVAYASRGALEANRETIEVLYLAGARDRFIASQVERRFLRTGLTARPCRARRRSCAAGARRGLWRRARKWRNCCRRAGADVLGHRRFIADAGASRAGAAAHHGALPDQRPAGGDAHSEDVLFPRRRGRKSAGQAVKRRSTIAARNRLHSG